MNVRLLPRARNQKKLPCRVAVIVIVIGFIVRDAHLIAAEPAQSGDHAVVEFNRDIRPILADNCYQCHGPDKAQRKADLRLDTEAGALADLGGRRAIVPGDFENSELYQRLIAEDQTERMPPAKTGKRLTAMQIALFRRWIEQGAKWQKHWAFLPPVAVSPPAVHSDQRVLNPVDSFILARLQREGLASSPEADRTTL